ncbi:hypothetical protein QIS99_28720 [Streptomyces sp. B-S-A8]|uniref:GPP34 family phosphoprotein n=1 Tax=Streptomyces solicavernae TaxID=3043614 RepID=A0ABT6S141_9ACTN|nr:hypothetical protein [Streptomyces sp. B-S-A8]MDI3390144.1 hypothetical protein [Streptomyces sp. B-S-A8]
MTEVKVALAHDGRSWVDGVEVRAADGTLDGARAAALKHVARLARQRRGPVLVRAEDPDGQVWELAVGIDGEVVEASDAHLLADDPDAQQVPAELEVRVATVSEALAADRGYIALKLAEDLDADLGQQHGLEHPHALRAKELHGHVHATAREGRAVEACALYLEAARGWSRLNSPSYEGALQRALALWGELADDPARIVWLGEQLVDLLVLDGSRAQPTAAAIQRRIDALRLELPQA